MDRQPKTLSSPATRISNSVNAYDIGFGGSLSSIPGSPFATDGTNGKALAFTPDIHRAYSANYPAGNEFHGAELGIAAQTRCHRWSLEGLAKLALGGTRSRVTVNGTVPV